MLHRYRLGFTLIELMVTISLIAILLALAVPSLQNLVRKAQLRSTTQELAAALVYARSEAIKRGLPVTMCKSANPEATSPSCSTDASWQTGWLVFVDRDEDRVADYGEVPPDEALRVGGPYAAALTISPDDTQAAFRDFVRYLPGGLSSGKDGQASGSLCIRLQDQSRRLEIGSTGHVSVEDSPC
jgi:type IV fimbrial biogenesis protein FimT